jgi:hypothetical protein
MPLPESHCSTCLWLFIRPLKEEEGLFDFGFYVGLWLLAFALEHEAFAFGFCIFGVRSF